MFLEYNELITENNSNIAARICGGCEEICFLKCTGTCAFLCHDTCQTTARRE